MAGNFPNLDSDSISQWPESNNSPITRSWFPAYTIALTVTSTIILFARLWTQARKGINSLRLDDILIFSAWGFLILYTASCLLGTLKYGFDKHIWDVSSNLRINAALVQWLSEGAFLISICLTKISVLCFYRRLNIPCTNVFRNLIYAFIALTATYTVAFLLTQLLLCRPTSSYWELPEPNIRTERKCGSQYIYYLCQGALDGLSTIYTIVIPFLVLRNIPMVETRRIALKTISVIAMSVVGAGIARTVFLFHLVESRNGDATWNSFNVVVCGQLELQLAIIYASLPSLHCHLTKETTFIFYANGNKHDSIISRVSSSLSGQIRRLPFGRSNSSQNLDASRPRPQAVEIPEWEFTALESPRHAVSPVDEITYEQYAMGKFGPPAPPKDSRALFDQYRREHGEIV